jgi:hypothetical protein
MMSSSDTYRIELALVLTLGELVALIEALGETLGEAVALVLEV